MSKKARYSLIALGTIAGVLLILVLWISQATATRHPVVPAVLGTASNMDALEQSLDNGTKVTLKTLVAADWQVALSGLLNLQHPTAVAEHLQDHDEPIKIFAYHIQHPKYGDFLIDTGVAEQFAHDPEAVGVPGWLAPQLGLEKLTIRTSTDQYMASVKQPIKAVFATHLHLDHISGLPAIDKHVPVYVGQGEASEQYFLYAATRDAVDAFLVGRPPLQEWQNDIVDIFADGSVFALHTPGHTAGSTAFLVNTTDGAVLLTGDACHTAWGWRHQVEPGKFSSDQATSRESLLMLEQLVTKHPQIKVRVGHQTL